MYTLRSDGTISFFVNCKEEDQLITRILRGLCQDCLSKPIPEEIIISGPISKRLSRIQNIVESGMVEMKMNDRTGERDNFTNKFISMFGEHYASVIWKSALYEGKESWDYRFGKKTVDVKTKTRNVPPKPYYDVTLETYLRDKEKPDLYLFCQISESRLIQDDVISGFFLGKIDSHKFWKIADFVSGGSSANGVGKFKRDNWRIRISDLENWK